MKQFVSFHFSSQFEQNAFEIQISLFKRTKYLKLVAKRCCNSKKKNKTENY